MKQLGVFSGKGGTGKTTLVACFARLAGRAVAVDCDVDAANLALLMPGEDIVDEPLYAGRNARIESQLCCGCGQCIEACRFHAIDWSRSSHACEVSELACEGCGACALACQVDAISFTPNQAGRWMVRQSDDNVLVHAALGIAQDNSGKLVAKVREVAKSIAEKEQFELILVDGPPGIGCPVHASLGHLDGVLAVTEPSPSGMHDLHRLLDLADHFGIATRVVINKWDLSPGFTERIERSSSERGTLPLGRIPFDPAVPAMLARGRMPLSSPASPATIAAIRNIWERFARAEPRGERPSQAVAS